MQGKNVTENAKIKQSVLSNFLFVSFSLEYGEKQCASGFWNGELEAELRELGNLDFFGLMKKNEDRERVMEEVDQTRAKSVYSHSAADCSDACRDRGEEIALLSLFKTINYRVM